MALKMASGGVLVLWSRKSVVAMFPGGNSDGNCSYTGFEVLTGAIDIAKE